MQSTISFQPGPQGWSGELAGEPNRPRINAYRPTRRVMHGPCGNGDLRVDRRDLQFVERRWQLGEWNSGATSIALLNDPTGSGQSLTTLAPPLPPKAFSSIPRTD